MLDVMSTVQNTISIGLLVISGIVAAVNWALLLARFRNRADGTEQHPSMVFLAGPILAVIGVFLVSDRPESRWLSPYVFVVVALADPALYSLIFALIRLGRSSRRT